MPLNFIPRIEAPNTDSSESGLDFKPISYLGAVFLKVLPERIEETIGFLARTVQEHGTGLAVYLDVTDLPSDETVTSLLDAGASKVVISLDQFSWLRNSTEEIDHSRLILKLAGDHDHRKEIVGHAAEHPPLGLYCEGVQDVGFSKEQLDSRGDGPNPHVYVSETAASEQDLAAHVKDINSMSAIPIVAASSLTVDAKANSKLASVAALLQVKSDRQDGLFSTVVTDERGVALGLVYSSHESILESLKTGRGVYHSRKRGLWYKGESSGDVQELVKIDLDCDGDCLNFVVRQKGRGKRATHALLVDALLITHRLLSPGHSDLLWTEQWSLTLAEDAPVSEGVCTSGVLHRQALLLAATAASKDTGGGRGAM